MVPEGNVLELPEGWWYRLHCDERATQKAYRKNKINCETGRKDQDSGISPDPDSDNKDWIPTYAAVAAARTGKDCREIYEHGTPPWKANPQLFHSESPVDPDKFLPPACSSPGYEDFRGGAPSDALLPEPDSNKCWITGTEREATVAKKKNFFLYRVQQSDQPVVPGGTAKILKGVKKFQKGLVDEAARKQFGQLSPAQQKLTTAMHKAPPGYLNSATRFINTIEPDKSLVQAALYKKGLSTEQLVDLEINSVQPRLEALAEDGDDVIAAVSRARASHAPTLAAAKEIIASQATRTFIPNSVLTLSPPLSSTPGLSGRLGVRKSGVSVLGQGRRRRWKV